MKIKWKCIGGRDLMSDDIRCNCGKSDGFYLSGYNDDYFFDHVNDSPHVEYCNKCQRNYWYQWNRDGTIDFFWVD